MKGNKTHIPFHLHPYGFEEGLHAVEKADSSGEKRRYLVGISSGIKTDGHGERMTKACIDNMQAQAKKGSVLLYEGQHGVTYTDDLGILVDSEITPMGEWITKFRLYDEKDGFEKGSRTLERAGILWKQVTGQPPYVNEKGEPRPLQKGFSIEGYIPDGGIVFMSESGQRVIEKVDLDGVLVTPRPSYKDSVITAVYKALDELPPQKKTSFSENMRGRFLSKIEDEQKKQSYYSKRFKLEDALNESIEEIMEKGNQTNDRLDLLLGEYSVMLKELILNHSGIFESPQKPNVSVNTEVTVAKMQRLRLLKSIEGQLKGYLDVKSQNQKKIYKEKKNGRNRNGSIGSKRKINYIKYN